MKTPTPTNTGFKKNRPGGMPLGPIGGQVHGEISKDPTLNIHDHDPGQGGS